MPPWRCLRPESQSATAPFRTARRASTQRSWPSGTVESNVRMQTSSRCSTEPWQRAYLARSECRLWLEEGRGCTKCLPKLLRMLAEARRGEASAPSRLLVALRRGVDSFAAVELVLPVRADDVIPTAAVDD